MATLILLTVLFFTVVDRSVPSDRFVPTTPARRAPTLYMSVFYLYLGAASAVCAFQRALATADARRRHLRIGLGMMTFAMFIGVGYTVSRTLFLWVSVVDEPSEAFALRFDQVTEAAQLVLFAFFALGASVPAFSTGARRARPGGPRSLHALWYELMAPSPTSPSTAPPPAPTRFNAPATRASTAWPPTSRTRPRSCATTPPTSWSAAAEAAARDAADTHRAAALGDAYWIQAALLAKESGAPAGPAAAVAAQQAADQDGEAARLERVAAAYRTVTVERAREVLAATTPTAETARTSEPHHTRRHRHRHHPRTHHPTSSRAPSPTYSSPATPCSPGCSASGSPRPATGPGCSGCPSGRSAPG
ncbi:Integral membrane protein OS=Streptomyces cyaneofuscatus OX=66883 GN=G3I52_13500 PE=4 SV=1 [Streptomyces cyaneofuscatus]